MEATTEISIIKVSDRGAYLITDGTMQAWTRPSSRRADGTWTAGAYEALRTSSVPYMTEEERKEAYLKAKEEEKERRQKPVSLIVFAQCDITDSEKSYKVATGRKIRSPYKRGVLINEYIYLPKSQVKLTAREGSRVFEIPTWLYETNLHSYSLIGKITAE
jgi:hypothetical protein